MALASKGNVALDTVTIFAVLFVIALAWGAFVYIQSELNDGLQADDDLNAETKQMHQDYTNTTSNVLDLSIFAFMVLFWGLGIITSMISNVNPIFAVFSIIILIVFMSIIPFLANTYEAFADDLGTLQALMPFTYFIMQNLLGIAIIQGFTIFLALFARSQQ